MFSVNWKLFGIFFCLTDGFLFVKPQNYMEENYPATVIEDGHLDTVELIQKYKYPAERHYVTTKDQYILCMHRLPQPKGPPVFLMHGLLDSSATWVLMGPWSGLAYYLHDEGYDVWLGNARGNRYSRNHTHANPDVDGPFWSFSWHEIGYNDLPAMIDYVLNTTGYKKLAYFGHSQGTTSFWVMASSRPEYNDKITIMNALAPVAFMRHIKVPLYSVGSNFVKMSKDMLSEMFPHSDLYIKTCLPNKIMEETCLDLLWQIMGKNDEKQLNMTTLPTVFGHIPAGCDLKQILHYVQLVESDRFCQYDHGVLGNMKRYGMVTPPEYPLENIRAPVALHYSLNDYLVSEVDVQRLAQKLPNVVVNNLMPYKEWNHMTMIWGKDARKLEHKRMLENMRTFE